MGDGTNNLTICEHECLSHDVLVIPENGLASPLIAGKIFYIQRTSTQHGHWEVSGRQRRSAVRPYFAGRIERCLVLNGTRALSPLPVLS
jgi:hypothetical protein